MPNSGVFLQGAVVLFLEGMFAPAHATPVLAAPVLAAPVLAAPVLGVPVLMYCAGVHACDRTCLGKLTSLKQTSGHYLRSILT
jgi:hypothetical protein